MPLKKNQRFLISFKPFSPGKLFKNILKNNNSTYNPKFNITCLSICISSLLCKINYFYVCKTLVQITSVKLKCSILFGTNFTGFVGLRKIPQLTTLITFLTCRNFNELNLNNYSRK